MFFFIYTKIYGHFPSGEIMAIDEVTITKGGHKTGFHCIYSEYSFYTLECIYWNEDGYILHF